MTNGWVCVAALRDLLLHTFASGVGGAREPDPVEYDLDNEDEDWLKTYNLGRNKLTDVQFEKMLWQLELACAEATDSALTAAGGCGAWRGWMGLFGGGAVTLVTEWCKRWWCWGWMRLFGDDCIGERESRCTVEWRQV